MSIEEIKAREKAATLTEEETGQLRRNFVDKLREPMRSDFRRVVDTIDTLRAELKEAREKLEAVKKYCARTHNPYLDRILKGGE